MTISTTLVVGQEQLAHDIVKDQLGNTDATDAVTWTVDNAAICSVTPGDSLGRSAMLAALAVGTANVTATCGTVTAVITVTVTAAAPAEIDITLDPATVIPVPTATTGSA